MRTFSKQLAVALFFAGQLSLASAGTSSGGGTFGPEAQINCGFNDGLGHQLEISLSGDPVSLGTYSAIAQEATLNGLFSQLSYTEINRMMPSEDIIEFIGDGFELSVDLTTDTDIPNQFEGIVQSKDIANNQPIPVGCTLNY